MDQQTAQPGKRILCIEDEHFIGELYKRALIKAGYQVDLVYDGQKGLEAALTNTYDVILLDIMIPSLKGTEILHRLRGQGAPDIRSKIIVTTNLDQGEENRQQVESMADGYIIKADITPKELVVFLDHLDTSSAEKPVEDPQH